MTTELVPARGWRRPLTGTHAIGLWTVCAGMVLLPLAAVPNAYDAFVQPKLLLAWAVCAILAATLVGGWLSARTIEVRRTPLDIPLALLLASGLVSTLTSIAPALSFAGSYLRYDGWWTLLSYVALFWLAVQTIRDPREARLVRRSALAAGALASLIGITQVIAAGPVPTVETAVTFGGFLRPDSTFGNPNAFAIFLALLLPISIGESFAVVGRAARGVAVLITALLAVALALTASRSAWLGAAVGVAFLVAHSKGRRVLLLVGLSAAALAAAVIVLGALTNWPITEAIAARLTSLVDLTAGSGGTRVRIWADTLALIGSRPVLGYGPDTFALVFPHFQTGDWTAGARIDKAHAELLQIGATQGVIGIVLSIAVMASVIRAFKSRDGAAAGGVAVFAGWLAYQTSLQVNFTSLAAAEPFWLITAAGVVSWGAFRPRSIAIEPRVALALGWATAFLALVIALNIARVYAADALFLTSVRAAQEGRVDRSLAAIADARRRAPEREQYAIVAGDLQSIAAARSSGRASWEAAIQSYEEAARLGASDPSMFRRLAVAYENLGRAQDAGKANAYAATLSPFDPRSRNIRPTR